MWWTSYSVHLTILNRRQQPQETFLLRMDLHSQYEFLTKGVLATPKVAVGLLQAHSGVTDIVHSVSPRSQYPDPCSATIDSFVRELSCETHLDGPHVIQ